MNKPTENIISVGGAHWDILGRAHQTMALYDDVPGVVRRLIGGVAGPVAMKLASLGAPVELMAYAGNDPLGDALLAKLAELGVATTHTVRGDHPTDVYLGVEAPNGLVAAVADCHSLEAVSHDLIAELLRHDISNATVILDGNLHADALADIAANPDFKPRELILVPASPGKIDRFLPFEPRGDARLYVNLREANALARAEYTTAAEAARALINAGYRAALVSNGGSESAYGEGDEIITETPPQIEVKRFTGAGDTLTGHHIFARTQGLDAASALHAALVATAHFISHEDLDV